MYYHLARVNQDVRGIHSDGTTLWVVDSGDDKVYAYTIPTSSGATTVSRDTDKEFDLADDNSDPWGAYSDGTTFWVSDTADDKIFAYTLSTGARDTSKEFSLAEPNNQPRGISGDGTTMWVADNEAKRLIAYHMAGSAAGGL